MNHQPGNIKWKHRAIAIYQDDAYSGLVTPAKKNPLGPTGEYLRQRIADLRKRRGMTYKRLSEALTEAGRPIPPLGLSRLEEGERRVDVDDLVAFARVLAVDVTELLYGPNAEDVPAEVRHVYPLIQALREFPEAETPDERLGKLEVINHIARSITRDANERAAEIYEVKRLAPSTGWVRSSFAEQLPRPAAGTPEIMDAISRREELELQNMDLMTEIARTASHVNGLRGLIDSIVSEIASAEDEGVRSELEQQRLDLEHAMEGYYTQLVEIQDRQVALRKEMREASMVIHRNPAEASDGER